MNTFVLPYLNLCRFPVVFSAISNSFLGYCIGGAHQSIAYLLGLSCISACSIMLGMVWNDLADYPEDSKTRSNRPLVTGQISFKQAWIFSFILFVCVMITSLLMGGKTFFITLALLTGIASYNFFLRGPVLGPILLAMCRLLNILLGISVGMGSFQLSGESTLLYFYPGYVSLIILFISAIAYYETQGIPLQLSRGIPVIFTILGVLGTGLLVFFTHWYWAVAGLFVWGIYVYGFGSTLKAALNHKLPLAVAVGKLLGLLPILDIYFALALLQPQYYFWVPLVLFGLSKLSRKILIS